MVLELHRQLMYSLSSSHSEQENASTQSAAMAGSLESRNKRIQELQEQVMIHISKKIQDVTYGFSCSFAYFCFTVRG